VVVPLFLQWLLTQLFLKAWVSGMGHCSVNLSEMPVVKALDWNMSDQGILKGEKSQYH